LYYSFTDYGPITDCQIPTALGIHFEFNIIRLAGVGAWELSGYADTACTEKLIVIGEADIGKGLDVNHGTGKRIKGIKA